MPTGSDGRPFLYLAVSAWALVKHRDPAEIDEFLDRRTGQGFPAIQFHAVPKEVSPPVTYDGIAQFKDINNIATPSEPYWKKVDYAVEACAKRNLAAATSALWILWGGSDKEGWSFQSNTAIALAYGEFLGRRYARHKNVYWTLGAEDSVMAAVSTTHLFSVVYLPVGRTVSIRPGTPDLAPVGMPSGSTPRPARTSAAHVGDELTPPPRNAAGDPVWVLFVTVRR